MLYYTGLLIAAVYLGKLSGLVVEHPYSLSNSQSQSQDNRKWIIHVLSVFALIANLNPTYIRSVLQPTVYPLLCTCRMAVS
jgi:hypothetical protein